MVVLILKPATMIQMPYVMTIFAITNFVVDVLMMEHVTMILMQHSMMKVVLTLVVTTFSLATMISGQDVMMDPVFIRVVMTTGPVTSIPSRAVMMAPVSTRISAEIVVDQAQS
jgi:hypothetical protein